MEKYKVSELVCSIENAERLLGESVSYLQDPKLWDALQHMLTALNIIKSELMKGDKNG